MPRVALKMAISLSAAKPRAATFFSHEFLTRGIRSLWSA